MQKLQARLLVTDLDNTLLTTEKTVSPVNKESIDRFRSAGGYFTIATGRTLSEAKEIIDILELDIPAILGNGAVLYDPKTEESTILDHISPSMVELILSKMESRPKNTDILVTTTNKLFTSQTEFIDLEDFSQKYAGLEVVQTLDAKAFQEQILKVVLTTDPSNMEKVVEWCQGLDLPLDIVQSSDYFLEILPKNVSKGNALTKLAEQLQVSLAETAAVGDHLNDYSMLSKVGKPFAVANAHPKIIQTAKHVVPSNDESAIHHIIQQYLMSDLEEVAK